MFDGGFIDYMNSMEGHMEYRGYRNMLIEDKIKEALDAWNQGITSISLDVDGFSAEEIEYIEKDDQTDNGD